MTTQAKILYTTPDGAEHELAVDIAEMAGNHPIVSLNSLSIDGQETPISHARVVYQAPPCSCRVLDNVWIRDLECPLHGLQPFLMESWTEVCEHPG